MSKAKDARLGNRSTKAERAEEHRAKMEMKSARVLTTHPAMDKQYADKMVKFEK